MAFLTDFKSFPFLRFKSLVLFCLYSPRSFKEKLFKFLAMDPLSLDDKFQLLQNQLRLFSTALSGLEKIALFADINQNDQSQFRDHSQLIAHLIEQMLPICHSSPVYRFCIDFQAANDAAGNFICQILQLLSIDRCQEVYFDYSNETFIQLPVDAISNWLNRESEHEIDNTGTGKSKKERILGTNNRIRIQNAAEMCDRLKMVRHFIYSSKILKKAIQIL